MKKIVKITFETEDGTTFGFEGNEANLFATAVAKLWEPQEAFENLLAVIRKETK